MLYFKSLLLKSILAHPLHNPYTSLHNPFAHPLNTGQAWTGLPRFTRWSYLGQYARLANAALQPDTNTLSQHGYGWSRYKKTLWLSNLTDASLRLFTLPSTIIKR